MVTKEELQHLLQSNESYRIERTVSTTNMDKFCEAICAFSNDMPNSRKSGYLLIGADDNGKLSGLKATDKLQTTLAAIRSGGQILPMPVMAVETFRFEEGDLVVVEVQPSSLPPVRYRGRTCIRIGSRKDYATFEEENLLVERRSGHFATFDTTPCQEATMEDLDLKAFRDDYLPQAIDPETLSSDQRSVKEQMAALRLYNLKYDCPTYAAILLFGRQPDYFLPGAYIQYVKFDGKNNAADIENDIAFKGNLTKLLPRIDNFINDSLIKSRPVPISALKEKQSLNYPRWAMRELMMNAIMHRDYKSNTPIKLYQYSDRVEITNAGGLFGNARPENFPKVNDYRNPIISEVLKQLGYVNKFNRGIARVQEELTENGNGKASFSVDNITVFEVTVENACKNNTQNDEFGMQVAESEVGFQKIETQNKDKTQNETQNEVLHLISTMRIPSKARQRLKELISLISEQPTINRANIASVLGVSLATVARDMQMLRNWGVQLLWDGGPRKGRWIIRLH